MPETRSINQNIPPKLLPDFRNLGTVLRIVLLTNGIALLGATSHAISFAAMQASLVQGCALLQPVLLSSLLLLYVLNPVLGQGPYWRGALLVVAVTTVITGVIDALGGELFS